LSSRPKYFGRGSFYRLEYDIILLFGLTELKAMVAWKQGVGLLLVLLYSLFTQCRQDVERRSVAKIIYDQDTTNDDPISV
jgi:hypothetical protein